MHSPIALISIWLQIVASLSLDFSATSYKGSEYERNISTQEQLSDIIVLGDVHGDYQGMVATLQNAHLIDDLQNWIGGVTYLIQMGDLLDRGGRRTASDTGAVLDEEVMIIDLLHRLGSQAKAAGGEVIVLLGNHELRNLRGDTSYAKADHRSDMSMFKAGTVRGRQISQFRTIVKRGGFIFTHAGIGNLTSDDVEALPGATPDEKIDMINRRVSASAARGVRLTERYANFDEMPNQNGVGRGCPANLDGVLRSFGATNIVVGHTIHDEGVHQDCGGQVLRVDTGLSSAFGRRTPGTKRGDLLFLSKSGKQSIYGQNTRNQFVEKLVPTFSPESAIIALL
jgi:hypothetical protein